MAAAGANSQLNPLENAKRQFDEAAAKLGLAEGAKEMLKKPRRTTIPHQVRHPREVPQRRRMPRQRLASDSGRRTPCTVR